MPTARRKCTFPGCPRTGPGGRCPEHAAQAERVRGTRQARGYDAEHDRLRVWWQQRMDAGIPVFCARGCGQRVDPAEPWALDHRDDRAGYLGPSHKLCNDRAGGYARRAQNERG